jgi:sigma-B regulation protein RsbU (phosphoserine phosphatase)
LPKSKFLIQELAEAADYVRTILPHPIASGNISTDWRFIPCSSVGGDAFGYHWLEDDHFVIYLIGVSGHGVGAALLSVLFNLHGQGFVGDRQAGHELI